MHLNNKDLTCLNNVITIYKNSCFDFYCAQNNAEIPPKVRKTLMHLDTISKKLVFLRKQNNAEQKRQTALKF